MSLIVETNPHQKSGIDTSWIMKQVVIALIPVVIASIYFFRLRAVLLIAVSVLSCCLSEYVFLKVQHKPAGLKDGSALVTGILLALILPPSIPLWIAFAGGVVAVVIGKQVFGGLGNNIFNPALVGRAFLMAAFPVILTTWVNPFSLDAVTQATPLSLWKFSGVVVSVKDLFLGKISGSLGETSALAIIIGAVYLFIRRVADWRAPLGMLLGGIIFSGIFYLINPESGSILFHVLSGGFLFGMVFMVTDPVTTPVTKRGRILFGFLVGVLVIIIRKWAGLPEGVMYSILFLNGWVPLINKITRSKAFGR